MSNVNDYHVFSCGLENCAHPERWICGVGHQHGAACRAFWIAVFEIV